MSEFDKKISQLTGGAASQATDEYVINRGGANFKITGANVAAAATSVGTLTSLTVSGAATFASTSGNVGVGTTSPVDTDGFGRAIDIRSGTGGQVVIRDNDDTTKFARLAFDGGANNVAYVGAEGSGTQVYLRAGGATRATIDSSGNLAVDTNTLYVDAANNRVGIGTASPSTTLEVAGSIYAGAAGEIMSVSGAVIYGTRTANSALFYTNNAEAMRIDASGNLGLGVTPSAWNTVSYRALQFPEGVSLFGEIGTPSAVLATNAFLNSAYDWKYTTTAAATYYRQFAGTHLWYNAPSGTAGNTITFTQAMTLDANGDWYIDGGTSRGRVFVTPAGSVNTLYSNLTGFGEYSTLRLRAIDMQFYTGAVGSNAERARITSGGYFKASDAGTYVSSTGAYHEFRNTADNEVVYATNTNASFTSAVYRANTTVAAGTGFNFAYWQANSVDQFRVRGDGTIFAQNTTVQSISDARLKENIVDATEGLAVITALRPVRYDWKKGYGNDRVNQLGFIAQEVEAVFPEAVSEWAMDEPTGEVDEDGKPITEKVDYKTVGPGALIPVLVKAIQELEARIAVLEAGA